MTSFHNGMTDGWAYIAEGADLVALSFRGTSSTKNLDTDFRVTLIHPDNTDQQLRVHEGFYRAFVKLNEGKLGIEDKMGAIKQATNGAVPIYITGHSLGGALAQIAAAVLGSDQVGACYTYGSPRVGNSYFDLWVKVPSHRVLNYADIVPQVPLPIVYRHSGDPRYMPDHATPSPYRFEPNLLERGWQMIRGLIQLIRAGSILGIQDHAIAASTSSTQSPRRGINRDECLFDHPRRAARAVHIPRNKAAAVAAWVDIGEAAAAGNAGIGMQDDLLPGFY